MRLVYIDENGNEIPVSGRPTSAENLPIAPGSQTSTAEAVKNKLSISPKYEFEVVLNGGATTTYTLTRTQLGVPSGARVQTVIIQERVSTVVYGMFYSCSVAEVNENCCLGAIFNPTTNNRTYYLKAYALYTT